MHQTGFEEALAELAATANVTTEWVDAWGNPQVVSPEHVLGVLRALTGNDLSTEHEIRTVARQLVEDRPDVEPVAVAWDGVMEPLEVSVPVGEAEIVLESGEVTACGVRDGAVIMDTTLPIGYHSLVLDGTATTHVLAAPRHAYPTPSGALGLISPLYSLRRESPDVGIGTLADLEALADLCRASGVAVVGTLPLVATFPDQPSPYAPASRRAWNELFVDFDRIPGLDSVRMADDLDPAWVDYDRTGSEIRRRLAEYSGHVSRTPRLRALVDAFLDADPEMRAYAHFRALADENGKNWRAWPTAPTLDPARVAYHETVQWLMDTQLRELGRTLDNRGQCLYLDLPIGCHPDGYDIWDRPELFAPASLGAPPDTLFVGGQDWGLPAAIPSKSREDGHANFRKAIQRQLSVAGLLRIDHVMGIHRAWWVPHGAGATDGAYVMQPTEEMFAIICIESVRARAGVVGENLGTVPPEIRTALDDHHLLGMAVAQDGVTEPRPNDLVALSSHDTPAFAAWWKAQDVDDLQDLGVFDDERTTAEHADRAAAVGRLQERFGTQSPEDTRDALMAWMAGTDAAVALLNLDDLLMEERRQNIPGTDWERPNWRLRHAISIDDMAGDPSFTGRLEGFAERRPD